MGTDRPQEHFAEFRSVSDCLRLQPDPFVLRQMDQVLEAFTANAKEIDFSEDFVGTMTNYFVEGFRRLDAIERDDPFWDGTNRRPTQYKLGPFCEKSLRDNPTDCQAVWITVAVQMVLSWAFDPVPWERLVLADRLDATWIVNAALNAEYYGSNDTVPEVVSLLRKTRLCSHVANHLNALHSRPEEPHSDEGVVARNQYIANWAGRVIEGCGEP